MTQDIKGFSHFKFPSHGIQKTIYRSKHGTMPLLILHELPGMSPSFLHYCRDMIGKDFRVYAPLLFKSPNEKMSQIQQRLFCISREFKQLFTLRSVDEDGAPFASWLLALVSEVSKQNPEKKIGVVGMCLTGSFAIAAIVHPSVNAAISCQPSYPFFRNIETLGLSKTQRQEVADRASSLSIPCAKGYRYKGDRICRASHMRALKSVLGSSFECFPELAGSQHSTLTSGSRNPEVFRDVLEFLNKRLK